jgi:uncharacterized protein (DUF58 family)
MIRRLQLLVIAAAVIVAAFSTGLPFLFYLVYLGVLVVGGSYVLTRLALVDLEAGYAVSQLSGHVGDQIRVTYTIRNTGLLPKPWLEVHNPSTLPGGLVGRAVSLPSRGERSWQLRVPLPRRGAFRIDPLLVRSGDPFGFFEATAAVGQGVTLIVYPRVEALPYWKLPTALVEGRHAHLERTLQTTPHATTVRPWAPGDAFNRIHWRSTARQGEIQVKEFDLEQTADAWIFLDLDARVHAGEGDESTLEVAVRAAAAIADRALLENRAVGITTTGMRRGVIPADRGSRQNLKIMQLLAAVEADGTTPLAEALVHDLPRLRRGMTAVVITPSVDVSWVRPLASLRPRGVASAVVTLDAPSYAASSGANAPGGASVADLPDPRQVRALQHSLAEFDMRTYPLRAGSRLAEVLTR